MHESDPNCSLILEEQQWHYKVSRHLTVILLGQGNLSRGKQRNKKKKNTNGNLNYTYLITKISQSRSEEIVSFLKLIMLHINYHKQSRELGRTRVRILP